LMVGDVVCTFERKEKENNFVGGRGTASERSQRARKRMGKVLGTKLSNSGVGEDEGRAGVGNGGGVGGQGGGGWGGGGRGKGGGGGGGGGWGGRGRGGGGGGEEGTQRNVVL